MSTNCEVVNITVLGECAYHEYTSIDFYTAKINIKEQQVKLRLWDTAGQDRFRAIVKEYFRKADGVLLVYDVTNVTSFHKLESWLRELRNLNEEASVLIVGNKTDSKDRLAVSRSTVKSYAESERLEYLETSALNGENVHQMMEILTMLVLERKGILPKNGFSSETETKAIHTQTNGLLPNEESNEPIRLYDTSIVKKKKCC